MSEDRRRATEAHQLALILEVSRITKSASWTSVVVLEGLILFVKGEILLFSYHIFPRRFAMSVAPL